MVRWIWPALGLALLSCSSCDRHDRSPVDHTSLHGAAFNPTALDQPLRNPFPAASEVRLFVNTDYDAKGAPIFRNPHGHPLTVSQRAEFESLIEVHTTSPDELIAGCFIPHHFFRYFDKSGKQVGELQVCFCCAGVEESDSSIRLASNQKLSADFARLKEFVRSLGEPTDVQCGETS